MDSIPDMANIMILLLILMFIWAVVGVTLFQGVSPRYFGDLQSAMFLLFIMMTQIGWLEVFDQLDRWAICAAAIYFSSFMVIGVFIFMKIIVAVVVSNLEETYANQRKQQKQKFRALKTSTNSTQGRKYL
ncbi:hypothetical protein BC829DRAFT_292655 [Chytridium lagenaria]|nr:hypothetical protein BC829DRAFT_292655 [Chytridium lagenaria]